MVTGSLEDLSPDNDSIDSEAEIALHAQSGACTGSDSHHLCEGSTHYFMVAHVARHLNLTLTAKDNMTVGVPNSERLPYLGVCSALPFSINGELFCIDFFIIALEGYEVVLRCNWLRTLGPIVWDFSRFSMAFWWLDHWVQFSGEALPARRHLLSPPTTICNFC
jgi:hypothetical protein